MPLSTWRTTSDPNYTDHCPITKGLHEATGSGLAKRNYSRLIAIRVHVPRPDVGSAAVAYEAYQVWPGLGQSLARPYGDLFIQIAVKQQYLDC